MTTLLEISHAVYYGIKPQVITNIYENRGGDTNGFGTLLLPNNYCEVMTENQKKAIQTLLKSNKSIFGNSEKISLEIQEYKIEKLINKEEFNIFLASNIE